MGKQKYSTSWSSLPDCLTDGSRSCGLSVVAITTIPLQDCILSRRDTSCAQHRTKWLFVVLSRKPHKLSTWSSKMTVIPNKNNKKKS